MLAGSAELATIAAPRGIPQGVILDSRVLLKDESLSQMSLRRQGCFGEVESAVTYMQSKYMDHTGKSLLIQL